MSKANETRYRRRYALAAMAVVAMLVATALGLLIGTRINAQPTTPATPGDSSVDAGFLRDMQAHHAQAVEMAVLIRDRTTDEAVRAAALDIELTQQQQIGQMYGLLASWSLPQTSATPMSWMDATDDTDDPHQMSSNVEMGPDGATAMPGMASEADLERLAGLRGREAERLFLELMIDHHRGGLNMAEYAAANADEEWVRTLATRIVEAQTSEIEALQAMLDDRGGPLE